MSIISAGTSNTTSLVYTGDTTGNLAFQTNGTTEAMRITTGGNVGIGTNNPVAGTGFTADRKLLQIIPSSGTANAQVHLGGVSGTILDHDDSNNTITTLRNLYGASSASAAMQLQSGYMTFGTGTSYTERMRIDSSGRVTQPFQPSFHVRVNNGAYISTSPVPFSNAVFNVGSNFNTSTYRFTAPVAGKYNFLLQMYLRVNTNQYVTFYLRVNDTRRLYGEFNQPSQQMYAGLTLPAIFDLSVGDFVDVEVVTNGSTYYGGNQETNFFGYLLG
jgi:hypothetical protein